MKNYKEALQSLCYFESDIFIEKMNSFNYEILNISYRDLVSDGLKGEQDQKYLPENGIHYFYQLLAWKQALNTFTNTMLIVCDNRGIIFNKLDTFDYILKLIPPQCKKYLQVQYSLSLN